MLECQDLVLHYGPIRALHGVSLSIPPAGVVSIVGANGAGKTSLLRTIMGLESSSSGRVSFDGQDISRAPTHRIARLGIAFVPTGGDLFPNLTVHENLRLGTVTWSRSERTRREATLDEQLALFPRLRERLGQRVRTLSGGEQQMAAIARALMGRPRMLLLDEPSFGLAPIVLRDILATLRRLNEVAGLPILLVEQNARLALDFARSAIVLANGSIVAAGPADELRVGGGVESVYFGGEPGE